jgi:hypothetical protein
MRAGERWVGESGRDHRHGKARLGEQYALAEPADAGDRAAGLRRAGIRCRHPFS